MHESRDDLIHLICEFQDSSVAWIRHPPMVMTPDGGLQSLRCGIFKLEALDHLHVRLVRIRYRRASPMCVKSPFSQWPIQALIAVVGGDDDMRLAVHEAAALVGADPADRKGRGVVGS